MITGSWLFVIDSFIGFLVPHLQVVEERRLWPHVVVEFYISPTHFELP